VGQLAKQLVDQQGGQFSPNTQTNPKEQCKAITIKSGKKVGSDVTQETIAKSEDNRREREVKVEQDVTKDSEHVVVEGGSLDIDKQN